MKKPVIIGISGGSGSGKTAITKAIENALESNITVISQDAYYKSFNHLTMEQRDNINYDHPKSIDNDYLIKQINILKDNVPVEMPIYDYTKHIRKKEFIKKYPTDVIIIEGILIFENKKLRDLFDIKIYVSTDSDIRILRRIERDMVERERTLDSIISQYRETVRPMHIKFVEPTKRYADIIIPEGGRNKIGIDMIVTKLNDIIS